MALFIIMPPPPGAERIPDDPVGVGVVVMVMAMEFVLSSVSLECWDENDDERLRTLEVVKPKT